MFFDHIPTKSCPRFMETLEMLRKEATEAGAVVGGAGRRTGVMGVSVARAADDLL